MVVHLVKLCVGADSVTALRAYQSGRSEIAHVTRMTPARRDELLDGGSLYWVIKGEICVRQTLRDLQAVTDREGISRCRLVLDAELVATLPRPRRPFQGWRYLTASDAPPDLAGVDGSVAEMPEGLRSELAALGLL